MPDVEGIAGPQLKSFIERIERLEDEKRALGEDIKEVYTEAKGSGFEPKIMRQIIKIRRMDKAEHDEQETLLDLYKRALSMVPEWGPTPRPPSSGRALSQRMHPSHHSSASARSRRASLRGILVDYRDVGIELACRGCYVPDVISSASSTAISPPTMTSA